MEDERKAYSDDEQTVVAGAACWATMGMDASKPRAACRSSIPTTFRFLMQQARGIDGSDRPSPAPTKNGHVWLEQLVRVVKPDLRKGAPCTHMRDVVDVDTTPPLPLPTHLKARRVRGHSIHMQTKAPLMRLDHEWAWLVANQHVVLWIPSCQAAVPLLHIATPTDTNAPLRMEGLPSHSAYFSRRSDNNTGLHAMEGSPAYLCVLVPSLHGTDDFLVSVTGGKCFVTRPETDRGGIYPSRLTGASEDGAWSVDIDATSMSDTHMSNRRRACSTARHPSVRVKVANVTALFKCLASMCSMRLHLLDAWPVGYCLTEDGRELLVARTPVDAVEDSEFVD